MAKWYEGANEASFKPAAGGYVFQAPHPWILARPLYYMVNEAQKAAIAERLRRWRRLLLMLVVVVFPLEAAIVVLLVLIWPETFAGPGFLPLILLTTGLLTPAIVLVPHVYLIRALAPLLADAPRTQERIIVREQLAKIAMSVSPKILWLGLAGGVCLMAASVFMLTEAIFGGPLVGGLIIAACILLIGAMLTGYFVYLLRLRARSPDERSDIRDQPRQP